MKTRLSKSDHQSDLNEIPVPFEDMKSNGGRIPDGAKYGDWMRRNDPVAFNVYCSEKDREHQNYR